MSKQKIAVLGGGIGSLASVYGITSKPNWQDDFDITVYQEGWRLGGKCASSRNPDVANRIEEHGLHIFFGFYDNAIKMMRTAYDEIDRPETAPLANFDAAFKPHSFIAVQEYIDEKWVDWPIFFPTNDQVPGVDANYREDNHDTPLGMISWLIKQLISHLKTNEALHQEQAKAEESPLDSVKDFIQDLNPFSHSVLDVVSSLESIDKHIEKALAGDLENIKLATLSLETILEKGIALLEQLFGPTFGTLTSIRQTLLAVEFGLYIVKGIIKEPLLLLDWDVIDHLDFRAWLAQNGAPERVTCSAITRSFYDLYLAYPQGNTENSLCGGNVSAGTLLHAYFLACGQYKGAIFWKMQAGMGETVIVPLCLALQKRGVKFEFFSRVSNLGLSQDKTHIASIDIQVQATLKDPSTPYDPFIDVKDLLCWPSNPNYSQLVEGDELKEMHINLESPWSPWQGVGTKSLQLGQDFDSVVLGISVGALPYITPELMAASPQWNTMVNSVQSSQTQAMQLWMKPNLEQTGWKMASVVMDGYQDPFNTWADMSQTLDKETWPQNHLPFSIAYFCNNFIDADPIPPFSDHDFPAREQLRVKNNAIKWLNENTGYIWPNISTQEGGLDWSQLVDLNNQEGVNRFDGQFWHGAINPSERYVLSVAGTNKNRITPDGSDFSNLFLTGDWVDNRFLNIGCVESTTVAGLKASKAISGYPERIFYVKG
ncbi:hypothetical protein MED121_21285 [Marinomonas sp. MED121]|uniref:NAD(P)-binding protein n=1 Tax=Marinomonas sp. MED121 TaxID=314277 RepID=UPI0000690890|nr:NAD(P)-binding protein [Marinomonas sp. MED121]EAQ64526.1 hypothetical protein MED121_21285 [Marinomonas sp. MED121]